MQIEHISGECLTPWWTAKQQRHLPICSCMFGKIIIDDKRMFAIIPEEFSHRCTGVWRNILHGCRVRSVSSNNDCIVHCTGILEFSNHTGNRRSLLTNRNINTVNRRFCFVSIFLVYDGINGNSGLPCLSVSDDQFTLSSSNRDHAVNGFQACLQRLNHRLSL